MQTRAYLAALPAIAGIACIAAAQEVVVPNAFTTVQGGGSNSFPFTGISQFHRNQQVYAATEFSAITGPTAITEIRFRPNWTSTLQPWTVSADIEILLSTVQVGPDQLVSSFSSNVGPDETQVLIGYFTYENPFMGSATTAPLPFTVAFPLQTPFVYDPSAGNLLMEVRRSSTTLGGTGNGAKFLDAQLTTGDGISRVYSSTMGAVSGTVDSHGLITQFVFAGGGCYANCDGSTQAPVLNVADFTCFLQKFAAGCS